MSIYSKIEAYRAANPTLKAQETDIYLAFFSRALLDAADTIQIDPNDLSGTMTRLIAAAVGGDNAALAALVTATDLTGSGVLTTLATNVGAHNTQGATLATALVALLTTPNAATIQTLTDIVTPSTPATTDTVTAGTGRVNETLYIAPAGTLAALTVVFPTNENSEVGQKLVVFSTHIVTALTVSAAGLTIIGTALTALQANTAYVFQKVAASTWIRIQ